MPITPDTMRISPYTVLACQENPPAGAHRLYTPVECRVTATITPNPMAATIQRISGNRDVAGDAYYLHFFNNKITSVRLPWPAPAGVQFFYTDNMSGCKFYVDRIGGSDQDIVVYHANTTQHGPAAGTNADVQDIAAVGVLDGLHNTAIADYAPAVPVNAASLQKSQYFGAAGREERRKQTQGRTKVEFIGGCTIMGFPGAASWEFYYQTWGDVKYVRSTSIGKALFTGHWVYLHNRRVEGKIHEISYQAMKVVDWGKIWP